MSGPDYGEPERNAPTEYSPTPQEPTAYIPPAQVPPQYGTAPQVTPQYGPVPEAPTQYGTAPQPQYRPGAEGPTDYFQNPYGVAPYAPGPPSQPPGPWMSPPQPPPPKKRRRMLWGSVIAVAIVLIGGGATAAVLYIRDQNEKNSDPRKIESLVSDFSDAVNNGDTGRIAGLMCSEEAKTFQDAVGQVSGAPDNQQKSKYEVRDVTVHGNAASAKIVFTGSREQMMYFRKESGKWTVCAPAKGQM